MVGAGAGAGAGAGWLRAGEERWWVPGGLTLALLSLVIATWMYKRRRMVRLINKIPGPPGHPLLGNALDVNIDIVDMFQLGVWVTREYGPMFKVWLGTTPLVVISGARQAEAVLSSQKHIEKSNQYSFFHPWLGNTGLFVSSAETWPARRKLLTPAFHLKILEQFLEVFHRQSLKMVDKLKQEVGKEVDLFPFITNCTLDAICETTMGCCINAQDDPESEYVEAVHRMQQLVQLRMLIVWLQLDAVFWLLGYAREQRALLKTLHTFTRNIVAKRRKLYEAQRKGGEHYVGKRPRLAFLDLLLEYSADGAVLSEESVREEVDLFVFAGHDTTTVAINWFLYLMGLHPEIQARVQEELDGIFQGSDRPATMDDLRQMRYTEMCIREALRLYPSVPYIGRLLKEDVTIDNYTIPAGTTIFIFTYAIHRDASQFPHPERFDPDRFLPENVAKRDPFSYIPFSAGPRNCLGQKFGMLEEKVMVSNVLRKFTVESLTSREAMSLKSEIVLRPNDGNFVRLHPRTMPTTGKEEEEQVEEVVVETEREEEEEKEEAVVKSTGVKGKEEEVKVETTGDVEERKEEEEEELMIGRTCVEEEDVVIGMEKDGKDRMAGMRAEEGSEVRCR
ncbi:cytochrome P450 4C1-like [Eriocheir sinensis]|uniref:cytochrome P450 4C1-like n=1 Tax=Eriocheir sinensis TaxID=95602 RepID=UPI0021C93596|nr:cytochrome P450 4C1-like [Eriocheir sinensis]